MNKEKHLFTITLSIVGGLVISLFWNWSDWQFWTTLMLWAIFVTIINPYNE